MRRRWRGRVIFAAVVVPILALLIVGGRPHPGDRSLFPATGPSVPVWLVSNGFHTGLLLPRAALASTAGVRGLPAVIEVGARFSHYDWLEVGWGEARFYRETAADGSIDWLGALRAAFRPGNAAVLHVVGAEGRDPAPFLRGLDAVRLDLSTDGFARLAARLDRTFARDSEGRVVPLGPGLYGPSLFYAATGAFSIVNVCNHWTAALLEAAGVPVWPLAATLPAGLIWDLKARSGLAVAPSGLPATAVRQ